MERIVSVVKRVVERMRAVPRYLWGIREGEEEDDMVPGGGGNRLDSRLLFSFF